MEQNITKTDNSTAPAKKQWQKPDFYLLDTPETGTGITGIEGAKTPNNNGPQTPTTANSKVFYHS